MKEIGRLRRPYLIVQWYRHDVSQFEYDSRRMMAKQVSDREDIPGKRSLPDGAGVWGGGDGSPPSPKKGVFVHFCRPGQKCYLIVAPAKQVPTCDCISQ